MDDGAERWKRISALLDQVLDLREAKEREREAKVARLLARTSARRDSSTQSGTSATPSPKPRRGEH